MLHANFFSLKFLSRMASPHTFSLFLSFSLCKFFLFSNFFPFFLTAQGFCLLKSLFSFLSLNFSLLLCSNLL
jgi:hypothetical protein